MRTHSTHNAFQMYSAALPHCVCVYSSARASMEVDLAEAVVQDLRLHANYMLFSASPSLKHILGAYGCGVSNHVCSLTFYAAGCVCRGKIDMTAEREKWLSPYSKWLSGLILWLANFQGGAYLSMQRWEWRTDAQNCSTAKTTFSLFWSPFQVEPLKHHWFYMLILSTIKTLFVVSFQHSSSAREPTAPTSGARLARKHRQERREEERGEEREKERTYICSTFSNVAVT